MNGMISVGEHLTRDNNISSQSVEHLRKVLDQVYQAFLNDSLAADDAPQVIQNVTKPAETEDEDTGNKNEDNSKYAERFKKRKLRTEKECALEKARTYPLTHTGEAEDWATKLASYMRLMLCQVNSPTWKALQELLLSIWSVTGVKSVVAVASYASKNSPTVHST